MFPEGLVWVRYFARYWDLKNVSLIRTNFESLLLQQIHSFYENKQLSDTL